VITPAPPILITPSSRRSQKYCARSSSPAVNFKVSFTGTAEPVMMRSIWLYTSLMTSGWNRSSIKNSSLKRSVV